MAIKSIIGAIFTCLAVASFNVSAALNGVLPATPGGSDFQAYYDDEADLTWLADASAAGTDMTWISAKNWAAGLNVAGITGWRLADTLQPDASCDSQDASGSYGYNCTGSEMGNLFYNVLGGSALSSITDVHNANYDLFSNVQADGYWTATEWALLESNAWMFVMGSGSQHPFNDKDVLYFAWAVHDGDVSADADGDGDGVIDSSDNCTLVYNPAQRDTDTDGYGNYCDPDFTNDLIVNAADLSYLKSNFFSNDPDADLNGDGVVNAGDLAILKSFFFKPPGPSYIDLPGQASLYYPLATGNTWQYFVTINETGQPAQTEYTYTDISKMTDFNNTSVYNVKADLLTLAYENENSYYSEENDGIYLHGFFDENADGEGFSVKITATSPVLFLKSAFVVGDTWSTTTDLVFEEEGVVTDTVPSTWTYSVIAVEDVTVPAGTFQNSYRILMAVSTGDPVTIETETIWFAKDAGIVKRESGDGVYIDELQYASINANILGQEEVYQLSNASLNDTYTYNFQSTWLTPTTTQNWSSNNSITFYGNGNCDYTGILDQIIRTDNVTPRTVESFTGIDNSGLCTYNLTSEGILTINSILGITSYAVNPDTNTIFGINTYQDITTDTVGSSAEAMLKQSSGLSNANLVGTYLLSAQSMVLTATTTEVTTWADKYIFDGNGNCNYIGVSENSTIRTDDVSPRTVESITEMPDDGTCTYSLASDGTLTIDGDAAYVFNPDNAVITGNNYFSSTDVATSIEVMVKQSSGLSNASLTGRYMVSGREADLTDPAVTQFWIWTGIITFDGNGSCNETGTTEEGVIRTDNVTPRTTEIFIGAPDNSSCTYNLASDGTLTIAMHDIGTTFSYAVNHDTTIIAGANVLTGGVLSSSVIERMVKTSN
jgi:hypothetical protein